MIAVAQQKRADEFFGGRELAFAEKTGRRDDIGRNRFQFLRVRGGELSLCIVADQLIETLEHAPGGRQSGIDLNRVLVRLDCARRILECDVTVAALLIETARPSGGGAPCRASVSRASAICPPCRCASGKQVQHVAVLRVQRAQRCGGGDRLTEAARLDQAADPLHLEFHAGGRRYRLRGHGHGLIQ